MATQMTMLATPAVASDMVGQPRKIEKRMLACAKLSKLKNKSSYVKIRNRCVITGRSRGIYNYFKISRIMIRELASKGLLPGVKKAT